MTPRVTHLEIEGYRSISDPIEIDFPEGQPLVLVGENNAGKSNIASCLDLILGDRWPGSWNPEPHDFYGHDTSRPVRIAVEVEGVSEDNRRVDQLILEHIDGTTSINAELADGRKKFPRDATRRQIGCVMLGADRRLSYQLSYGSQWTLLSRLMSRFHKALISEPDRQRQLREHFETLTEIFEAVPEYARFSEQLAAEVRTLSGNMLYALEVEFSAYDPSNYFHALRVLPRLQGVPRTFAELGTGQEQILALSFVYAYAAAFGAQGSGLILVIEEPEAHLHPLAQEWLATQLDRYQDAGVQVVVTTHSPAFLSLRHLDGLVLVRKSDAASPSTTIQVTSQVLADHCQQRGAAMATPHTILDYYDVAATTEIRSGFFARAVVLVEGPSDAFAIPVLSRRLGLDLTAAGIGCIPVGGKGNLAKWWRLFTAYGIPIYVIFDNDTSEDQDQKKRRDLLLALGLDNSGVDNRLGIRTLHVEPQFAIFGDNYEKTMRLLVGRYTELEATCSKNYGPMGKPLVARWVAERLDDLEQTTPLKELVTAMRNLVPRAEDSQIPPDGGGQG